MAEIDDSFASIIPNCRYSSSQEDFLTHSKFAGENATFAGNSENSTAVLDSGQSEMDLSGKDVVGGSNRVEFEGVYSNCEEDGGLGFQMEKKRSRVDVVLDAEVSVSEVPEMVLGSSIEPSLKKFRVSESNKRILNGGKVSHLVQCNEKLVIDCEDKNKQIVVFRGDVRVEIVCPVTSGKEENRAEKKFEFGNEVEVDDIQDEGTIEAKDEDASNDVGNSQVGNENGTENLGDGSIEEIERRKKRELPRSLLEQTWGLSTNESHESRNGENRDIGERNVEGNGGEALKTDETIKHHHLLDGLKMLATYDADEDEMSGEEESRAEKKLEFGNDAEVVDIQDERTTEANNGEINNDLDNTNCEGGNEKGCKNGGDSSTEETERQREQEDGNLKGTENLGDGLNEEIERRETHDLPRSLFGQTRGLSTNVSDGSRNGQNRNRVESSKTEETLNHNLLYALKMLANRNADVDAGKVDIIETAKKRGMTFPCSRFLLDTKKN